MNRLIIAIVTAATVFTASPTMAGDTSADRNIIKGEVQAVYDDDGALLYHAIVTDEGKRYILNARQAEFAKLNGGRIAVKGDVGVNDDAAPIIDVHEYTVTSAEGAEATVVTETQIGKTITVTTETTADVDVETITVTGTLAPVIGDNGEIAYYTVQAPKGELYIVEPNGKFVPAEHVNANMKLTGQIRMDGENRYLVVEAFTVEAVN